MATKFLSKIMPDQPGGQPGMIRFVLGNGLEVRAEMAKIPAHTVTDLSWHGLSQKGGDAASSFSKAGDFSGAFGAMQQVVDNLENGVWSTRGQGGGTSDLVAAICGLRDVDVVQAQAVVDGMDEDQLKKILAHPTIKAKIADLKAVRLAAAAVNASDLDELLDL
jgi:hypothetical protein